MAIFQPLEHTEPERYPSRDIADSGILVAMKVGLFLVKSSALSFTSTVSPQSGTLLRPFIGVPVGMASGPWNY